MPRCPICHRRLVAGFACPRDQRTAPAQAAVEPGPRPEVPGYELGERLGGGGFATVWSARATAGHDPLAIKIAHVATELAGARFAREAEALGRVGPPHVPALHDRGVLADGRPYLVMERVRGTLLSEHLGRLPGPPGLAWVRAAGDAMLAALEAVHACGLIHGDLSPDNVFLVDGPAPDSRLVARLIDLSVQDCGVARAEQGAQGAAGPRAVVGTVEYMAPEQLAGHCDARAEIYAAGVLLYEMVTLRVPFAGTRAVVEHGHRALLPPRPSELAAVPRPLEELCLACLAKDPERRPASIAALRSLLGQACQEAASAAPAAPNRLKGQGGQPEQPGQPAPQSQQPGLLGDGHRPVVLLVAEAAQADAALAAAVVGRKGVIARQHGKRYVCGFSGLDDEEPAHSALAAARDLVAAVGARVALHVARLKVRRGRGGRPDRLYGAAVEEPGDWLPSDTPSWRGILLTAAFARTLPGGRTRPSPACPGFYEPALTGAEDAAHEPRLVGRDDVVARAQASLDTVLRTGSPGLFTIMGASGLGKSRLASQLEALARRSCPEAQLLALRAARHFVDQQANATLYLMRELVAEPGELRHADESGPYEPRSARGFGDRLRQTAALGPVVVILDDAHLADSATLDALEYATLDGEDMRLWVVVASHPRLLTRRPQWGQRAHHHVQVELEPLDETAAMKLAAELLHPAEYPPAAALQRLARWAGGNPNALHELVDTLKREGMVRKRPASDSWYLATAELDRLPPSPAEQWLAARRLEAMMPELAACMRLCAVLGVELLRDELEWVQQAAAAAGTATTPMAADAGLAALEHQGILAPLGDGLWAFPQAAFHDAVYDLVDARDRQAIHGHALAFWRAHANALPAERVLTAIARHASGAGAVEEAVDAFLALGDRARAEHRDVDADQHYTAALALLDADEHGRGAGLVRARALRARALGGRGKARYHLQRSPEALVDLRTAQAHARALGNRPLLIELLLEEATALDWAEDFAESGRRTRIARLLARHGSEPRLEPRLWAALGRSAFRSERIAEAIELLGKAVGRAAELDDHETRSVALLLLGPALVLVGRLDEAEARFQEVIQLCKQRGDNLHLCAAYSNRAQLWLARKSLPGIAQDLRRAVKLAREIGQPMAERVATHNLAEFLHWSGRHREALPLARRAHALQRFLPTPVAPDLLLLARIHAALDELDAARDLAEQARALLDPGHEAYSSSAVLAMLELVRDEAEGRADPAAWDMLLRKAEQTMPGEELLEVYFFRGRADARAGRLRELGRMLRTVRPLLDEHPVWQAPFATLAYATLTAELS